MTEKPVGPQLSGISMLFLVDVDSPLGASHSENENSAKHLFSKALPLVNHGPQETATDPLALRPLQSAFTSLQNLAHRAIAKIGTDPATGLGGGNVYITTDVCKKKGRKARRREGDKCFFGSFLFRGCFLIAPHGILSSGQRWSSKMRDLGTAGEKYFGVLCAAAGMAANKSETDIHGWDLFVEIDNSTNTFDRMAMHEGVIETKIQVKSTDGDKKSVDVELSNLKKMATSSLPCFYVLLEFDGGDVPARGYLRHFDNHLIKKTLRRVSDEHAKEPNVRLNKKKMRLNFDEPITPLSASAIKQMMLSHIGPSHFDYLERKREYLKSVGFEEGSLRIKFEVVGDDKLHRLIDMSLGKKDSIEIGEVHGSSLRFGIISERNELTSETALLTMPDVTPSDKGFISFRDKSNGRVLKFPVDLYNSPFDSWVPKNFRKIRMDGKLFEFHVLNYGKSFNISMNIHLLEQLEVEEAFRMFKLTHMLSKPQNIDLTFEFQSISSTAYLNSGEGFPDQSNALAALDKIIKIKHYFEIDTPLHFSAIDINSARAELNQLTHAIEGTPEIFNLNFSSTNDINTETELECFHILSFQLGRYVFLELVLFIGKAVKAQDRQYNITPTEKKSFYKTMLNADSADKITLQEEIKNIIDSYKSSRQVINFAPAFFAGT